MSSLDTKGLVEKIKIINYMYLCLDTLYFLKISGIYIFDITDIEKNQ